MPRGRPRPPRCSTPSGITAPASLVPRSRRERLPHWCSTPSGITALHHLLAAAIATAALAECSTPSGITALHTPASAECAPSSDMCSTPSGITALHHLRDGQVAVDGASAQRLPASRPCITASTCATPALRRKRVLNAFRHHGPASRDRGRRRPLRLARAQRLPASRPCIPAGAMPVRAWPWCSTPSGITALHTHTPTGPRPARLAVLNAFRHHGPAYTCNARSGPTGAQVCSTPSGITALHTRRGRRSSTTLRDGAQRLPASRPCIPRPHQHLDLLHQFSHSFKHLLPSHHPARPPPPASSRSRVVSRLRPPIMDPGAPSPRATCRDRYVFSVQRPGPRPARAGA